MCVCVLTLLVVIIQLCVYVKAVQLADLLLLFQAWENKSRTLCVSGVIVRPVLCMHCEELLVLLKALQQFNHHHLQLIFFCLV